MCGIVGYIGKQEAAPILMDGLEKLSYRGYDSAGIAVIDGKQRINVRKAKGKLENLTDLLSHSPVTGCIGIGHTRWATHGEPSDLNAHPHTDVQGGIAVVHNGIIENHEALRRYLTAQGAVFISQTDTEVIAHLLNHLYRGNMQEALLKAMPMLEGSYALGVLSVAEPDKLYCTRKDSPLVVGLADGEQIVASDIPALIMHTREVELLDDKEIAVLSGSEAKVYDPYGVERPLKPIHVDWDVEAAEKGGYAHFMLKEIHEQPDAIRRAASHRINSEMLPDFSTDGISEEFWTSFDSISIIACGSATHAGLVGRYVIEKLSGVPVTVNTASEYRYDPPAIVGKTLALAISQSGETADTLAGLRLAKSQSHPSAAIINAVGSAIAREADCVIYTGAGPEIAVAATKGYATQVAVLCMMGIKLGLVKGTDGQCFTVILNGSEESYTITKPDANLTVGSLQNFLDGYLAENNGVIDYIHGDDVVRSLCKAENSIGFLLPSMTKAELFPTVIKDGALPRKTFSMGHAHDKRFYCEARKIR